MLLKVLPCKEYYQKSYRAKSHIRNLTVLRVLLSVIVLSLTQRTQSLTRSLIVLRVSLKCLVYWNLTQKLTQSLLRPSGTILAGEWSCWWGPSVISKNTSHLLVCSLFQFLINMNFFLLPQSSAGIPAVGAKIYYFDQMHSFAVVTVDGGFCYQQKNRFRQRPIRFM